MIDRAFLVMQKNPTATVLIMVVVLAFLCVFVERLTRYRPLP